MTLEDLMGVLRALAEPSLVLSGDGAVLASNRAAQQALGLPATTLHTSRLAALVQQPERIEDYLRSCARSLDPIPGAFTVMRDGARVSHFRCDGARLGAPVEGVRDPILLRFRPRDVDLNQFVVLNERLQQLTAEVKKRQVAEAALRESEERFRLLVELVPQLVWVVRPDGHCTYVNQRWHDFTGADLQQVQSGGWIRVLHPDDIERVRDTWHRSLATGELFQVECRLRQASDHTWRWFLTRALPTRDGSGHIIKWFGTCTDIHEQKRTEQAAMEAVGIRDEFLSVAAHELRTPLTSLKLQLSLLAKAFVSTEGKLPLPLETKLQAAHRQIARLNALNDSLLDVSRISTGRLSLELQPVDLSQLVRECVERLEAEFARAGCTVSLDLQPEVVGCWDPLRLDQVVVNLLTNAARYGPGKPIELRLRAAGGWGSFSVKDFGIGIAPEAITRIFRKFERAVPAANYGGLGLGLYITQQIIDAMGGRITVESSPGAGSTFTIHLPQARQDMSAGQSPHPLDPCDQQGPPEPDSLRSRRS
ncbi:PAS domain-containing sensor histidine kinase [Archangium sp.]|uniref:sensor histidine kinase n=1 Tax=Archangium sp. TaxID=1872627 RepID=UPI002D2C17EA|nr:PAS domain-containing sensor histidine kinase [Archangium sp.]HYO51482.1 PAS domain-containing sensor histidine kinase [Archangium sp.]